MALSGKPVGPETENLLDHRVVGRLVPEGRMLQPAAVGDLQGLRHSPGIAEVQRRVDAGAGTVGWLERPGKAGRMAGVEVRQGIE